MKKLTILIALTLSSVLAFATKNHEDVPKTPLSGVLSADTEMNSGSIEFGGEAAQKLYALLNANELIVKDPDEGTIQGYRKFGQNYICSTDQSKTNYECVFSLADTKSGTIWSRK